MAKKEKRQKQEPSGIVLMSGKEVAERLLEAGSKEELDDIHKTLQQEGVPDGTIRATITKLRKKGHLIFQTAVIKHGDSSLQTQDGEPMPIEEITKWMKLPEVTDGNKAAFDSGVDYATRMIIGGVRIAQELSRMGVAQASPIIKMAQEMDRAKGESARDAGAAAAEEMAQQLVGYLGPKFDQLGEAAKPQKVDIATVKNPMGGVMARNMERIVDRMFDQAINKNVSPGQPKTISLPAGWKDQREQ